MPDDHSALVPPLPIPNRTVKRRRADDSAATSVKVGNRQACYMQKPRFNEPGLFALWVPFSSERVSEPDYCKIDAAVWFLDSAVRKMLDLQAQIHIILKYITDPQSIAEFNPGR